MSKSVNKRIQSNLLQQNCFVREAIRISDLQPVKQQEFFTSLDEVVTDKGIEFAYNDYPYPITPQYVNSFVDSADYRKDPASAIANGVKRSNLGDISKFNDISSMDSSQVRALYDQLSKRFSKAGDVKAGDSKTGDVKAGDSKTGGSVNV